MTSVCADRSLRVIGLVLALAAGCADHRLDLSLALASDSCTTPVPAGGSILYQVTAGPASDGGPSFCGGCLPVGTTLADADGILAFLRATAPACNGVKPGTSLRVALTAFAMPGCPDGSTRLFCSQSPSVTLPDGTSDAVVSVTLTCDSTCSGGCKPSTCAALAKNCGPVSDGCNGTLQCGSCTPPQQCGGHGASGVPNVCSK
jgi:hypothetical protein